MHLGRQLASTLQLLAKPVDPDEAQEPDRQLIATTLRAVDVIQRYFRCQVHGLEHLPQGPALLVGNHNAGITFLDPFVLGAELYRRTDGREVMHYLGHDAIVALPALGKVLLRLGLLRASHRAAANAFAKGRKVVVFPGGNYEAFRPFTERHRVDFGGKSGFARLALRHRVPIVPVLSIGSHETFFVLRRGRRLARWTGAKRLLRSESFPLFVGLPWGIGVGPIFHLPLPAKSTVVVGEPIGLDGYSPEDADNREVANGLALQVQGRLQAMMDQHAVARRLPILG